MLSFNFSFSFFGNAVSYKSEKIQWKVSNALSGELLGKILFHFIFSSRNLKVLVFSRLIIFGFSREHLSLVVKTVNIGK